MTENSIILMRRNAGDVWEEIILPPTADYFLGWNSSSEVVAKPSTTPANVALLDATQEFTGGNVFSGTIGGVNLRFDVTNGDPVVYTFGDPSVVAAFFSGFAAEGTVGTPMAVSSGKFIGGLSLRAFDGTSYGSQGSGAIVALTTEAQTPTGHGTQIAIYVTPNATTSRVIAALFDQDSSTKLNGNLSLETIGKVFKVKEGVNASAGVSPLVAGTVTVATTAILTGDRVELIPQGPNASTALGLIRLGAIVNATSFVINSLKPADATVETGDVSSVYWRITRAA